MLYYEFESIDTERDDRANGNENTLVIDIRNIDFERSRFPDAERNGRVSLRSPYEILYRLEN